MSELVKTAVHLLVAGGICALAVGLGGPGRKKAPEVFAEQGEPFFPAFTDLSAATALEVFDWDAQTAETEAFKVELKDGVWRIPSKHDHPADAKEKLGKVAGALHGLKRETFRTNLESEHEAMGVVDPCAGTDKPIKGRGRRVTLKDKDQKPLADLIIGEKAKEESGKRWVRLPDDKRVYAVAIDLDFKTEFSDWIETDLLLLDVATITTITHEAYTVDEQQLRMGRLYIDKKDTVVLGQKGWSEWVMDKPLPEGKQVKRETVDKLTGTLDDLKIKDVLPFEGDAETFMLLGFFYIPKEKKIYSNEGELQIDTKQGVRYILRFGEARPGEPGETGERRYARVDVEARYEALPNPDDPEARKKADETLAKLVKRFNAWYYVISAESYAALKPTREGLIEDKPPEPPPGQDEHGPDDGHGHGGHGHDDPDRDGDGMGEDGFFAPPPGGDAAPVDTKTPPGETAPPPGDAAPVDTKTAPGETAPPGENTPPPPGDQAPPPDAPPGDQAPPEMPPGDPTPPPESPPGDQAPPPESPGDQTPPPDAPAPAPAGGDVAPVDSPSGGSDVAPVDSPR